VSADLQPGFPHQSDEEYITAVEAAGILKVDEKTLYRWIKREPTLPALKIQGTVRIPKARFLKWLRQHEQGQATRKGRPA
jgi:excisionase family DNA binding protein